MDVVVRQFNQSIANSPRSWLGFYASQPPARRYGLSGIPPITSGNPPNRYQSRVHGAEKLHQPFALIWWYWNRTLREPYWQRHLWAVSSDWCGYHLPRRVSPWWIPNDFVDFVLVELFYISILSCIYAYFNKQLLHPVSNQSCLGVCLRSVACPKWCAKILFTDAWLKVKRHFHPEIETASTGCLEYVWRAFDWHLLAFFLAVCTTEGYHPTFEGDLKEARKKKPADFSTGYPCFLVPKGRLELPLGNPN